MLIAFGIYRTESYDNMEPMGPFHDYLSEAFPLVYVP